MSRLTNTAKFDITLDHVNQYRAGYLVSGNVCLSSRQSGGQNLNVGSISITFSGRTTTSKHVRDVQSHRRSLELFSYSNQIYSGPGQLYAPCRSHHGGASPCFPFNFTFPTECEFSQAENFEGAPFFNADRTQPLPPSFTDIDTQDKASVVYELSVELLAPPFKGYYMEGSFVQKLELDLCTQRNVREPTVQYTSRSKSFIHQSLELFPAAEREIHKRPITIGQKLGLKQASTNHYPKAAFQTTILIPSVAIIDQPLPLRLHVDHDPEQSAAATPPIIHLKQVQVWLRAETAICDMTHKALKLDLTKGCEQTGWTIISLLAQKSFHKVVPRVEHLDLRKVMDLNLDPSLVPTFKSFNVARTYSLRAGVRIECAGKDFHLGGFDFVRCTLLAKDFSPSLPDYTMRPPSIVQGEESIDDAPPPYEQVVGTRALVQQVMLREPSPPRTEGRGGRVNFLGATASSMGAAAASSSAAAASSGGGGGGGGGC